MKLTIGMIVKNEEKYLERCLTALKPILDNVDSELIITDTGSTDRTVEIAGKFTDKLLHFDWIGDFSAARNTALDIAQGEWFMFLDADEIFQSCDNIISFFNSGDYKNYCSASLTMKNLTCGETGHTAYNVFFPPRLVKLTPESRFNGRIHETIDPFDDPMKIIEDLVNHYGYYYTDDSEKENKFKRNSELLLKELEKSDDIQPLLYVQLYETFMTGDHHDEAMEYLEKGIECAKKRNNNCLSIFYFYKAVDFYRNKQYSKIEAVYNEYFNMNKSIRYKELSTDAEMYALMGDAYSLTNRYEDALNEYKKYFETYNKVSTGKLITYDYYLAPRVFSIDSIFLTLFDNFLMCCIYAKKFNTAESYLTSIPLYKYCIDEDRIIFLISYEIKILDHFRYQGSRKYIKQLNGKGKQLFREMLLIRTCVSDDKLTVFKALDEISDEETKEKANVLREYFNGSTSTDILEKSATQLIDSALHSYEVASIYSSELLLVDSNKLMQQLADIANKYGEECDSEPGVIKAVRIIKKAAELRRNKQYKDCIAEIKKAVEIYKPLAIAVSEYSKDVLKEFEESANTEPQNEMQKLAAAIKQNIRAYVDAGNIDAARKTLDEFKRIVPNDPEIRELEALIENT